MGIIDIPEGRVAYSEDPKWSDIEPVPQADPGTPLVPILYNPEYKEAMGYFRGIMKKQEYSERVLDLTLDIIKMNAAHYTVWQYRYETLLQIGADLNKEIELMDDVAAEKLKHYQVWHHRRLLQLKVRKPLKELEFITKALKPEPLEPGAADDDEVLNGLGVAADTKNYHTWSYRQWLLAEFNTPDLWANELKFVESMIQNDIRNNSAWNHRFFAVFESGVQDGDEDRQQILWRELEYTKDKISVAPNNASAWNYLRGVLQKTHTPFAEVEQFVTPYTANAAQKASDGAAVDLDNPIPSSTATLPAPLAIEFLADIYAEKAKSGSDDSAKSKATELYDSLATQHDTIRKRFWEHKKRSLNAPVPAAA